MEQHEAEKIVEIVQTAWDWVMPPETFRLWQNAIAKLADAAAAELAVTEVWADAKGPRPRIGAIREHYFAVVLRQRLADEETAARKRAALTAAPMQPIHAGGTDEAIAALAAADAAPPVGWDSPHGRVCRKHNRWVGAQQIDDECYDHTWGEKVSA